jgi:hypothetical protein
MKTHVSTILLLAIVFCLQASSSAQIKAPLTNDDIVQMVSNGLQEEVVIGAISASDVSFDVSPNALLRLKKANVNDKIIQAVLAAQKKSREESARLATLPTAPVSSYANSPRIGAMGVPIMSSGAQTPMRLPQVTLVVARKTVPLQPSTTQIANSKGKGGSAAGSIFKGLGKGMMMAGGVPGTSGGGRGGPAMPHLAYTWALPGRTSQCVLPDRLPGFEVEFGDIAGIDPDGYEPVIVKLVQTKDNWRLVETSKDKFDKHGNDLRSTKPENEIAVKVTETGRGHLQVTPAAELEPGEYGLVLHSRKDHKVFAGVPEPNVEALFYSVWDFSIQGQSAAALAQVH